jgi:hypothetical protein
MVFAAQAIAVYPDCSLALLAVRNRNRFASPADADRGGQFNTLSPLCESTRTVKLTTTAPAHCAVSERIQNRVGVCTSGTETRPWRRDVVVGVAGGVVGSAATTTVMRSRSRSHSHNPPPAGSLVDASVGAGTSTAPPTPSAAFNRLWKHPAVETGERGLPARCKRV